MTMKKEEYDKHDFAIKEESKMKKELLNHRFVNDNNPIRIGDIIRDHIGCGKVVGIGYTFPFHDKYPYATYKCTEYTLKGLPKKNNAERTIHQCNIISINGKEYKYRIE